MPNLTNYHSHCLYCDGRANMEDFIRFAISAGFTSYRHISLSGGKTQQDNHPSDPIPLSMQ